LGTENAWQAGILIGINKRNIASVEKSTREITTNMIDELSFVSGGEEPIFRNGKIAFNAFHKGLSRP
jgi:hypothetical protein